MTGLRFDRIWASDQNWAYPTDSQTARGLSFLGTEEPTFDLHDVMFKELDLQDKWLYNQVRNACERFGQKVQNDDGSAMDGARDAMANAITNALITQRKADEGGYGIVKMANAETTMAGQEYNQAVSPKHLAEYVSDQNTWANMKDKPQTATRWPKFDEVTDKPIYGDIVWSKKTDFDPAGSASNLEKRLGDSAFWDVKKDNGLAYDYGKLVSEGSVKAEFDSLGAASHWSVQESADIWKQEYGKGTLAREATMAAMRDWVESFKNTLKSASTHEASDFDAAGSAQAVLEALNKLDQSLASISKSGKITDTTENLPISRIEGLGKAATFDANTSKTLEYNFGRIASEGTVKANFDNLGAAATYGVKTDWDFEKAEYGTGNLAREAHIAFLRDSLRATDSTLGFAFAKYIGDSAQGRGAEVAGELLLPASAEYSFDGSRLVGIWKSLGVCQSKKVNIHGQQTTLWVRIK